MKIIIAGAGQGGLSAAYEFAKNGHEVDVYEAGEENNFSYDWHDDMAGSALEELGIPLPKGSYSKGNWSFHVPNAKQLLKLDLPKEKLDFSVDRGTLTGMLVERAQSAGARMHYQKRVESAVVQGAKVVGAVVDGETLFCDLLVDSCGAFSPVRESLPQELGIQNKPNPQEVFYAYRAFFAKIPGAEFGKEHTNIVYLKYMGIKGIAWCIDEPSSDTVNVLVGQAGGLSQEELDRAMAALRVTHPCFSETVVHGGRVCRIPVRYPLSKMVADGYAAVGDAAFMTIPMLGSGIASSLRAGKMLADAVGGGNDASVQCLWAYQARFFEQIGAEHASIDVLKRWLLTVADADIFYLFDRGVVGREDLESAAGGGELKLSIGDMIKKAIRGIGRLPLLLKLSGVLEKGKKASKIARNIPKTYEKAAVAAWQRSLDAIFE